MADTIKSSSTVDVQIYDENNNLNTAKIENPRQNITKADVTSAFSKLISCGYFVSSYGGHLARTGTVTISESSKRILEGSGAIITPANLTLTLPSSGGSQTGTLTVTGGIIQTANFETFPDISNWGFAYVTFDDNTVTVTLQSSGASGNQSITINVEIVIEGISHLVPVTLQRP